MKLQYGVLTLFRSFERTTPIAFEKIVTNSGQSERFMEAKRDVFDKASLSCLPSVNRMGLGFTQANLQDRLLFSRETDWIAWPSSKYLQLLQILCIWTKYYLTLICKCDHWTYNANVNGGPRKLFVLQRCYLLELRYKNVQCPVNNVDNVNIVIALLIWSRITSGRL